MCTIMGVTGLKTLDKSVWLASTSDNPYVKGPRKPVVLSLGQGGGKILHTPCLEKQEDGSLINLGSDRGMNESGLAWTRSWVVPSELESAEAISPEHWFMALGDKCSNVEEAIAFIIQTPKGKGCQGNYMLGDKAGNLACVEVGYQTVKVSAFYTVKEDGWAVRVNRFEDLKQIDASEQENPVYFETSETRFLRCQELMQKTSANYKNLSLILQDTKNISVPPMTEHGMSICSLGRQHGSVSAEIMHPLTGCFYYTYGWPHSSLKAVTKNYFLPLKHWGKWRTFDLNKLSKPGLYTTWDGELTELGLEYFNTFSASTK